MLEERIAELTQAVKTLAGAVSGSPAAAAAAAADEPKGKGKAKPADKPAHSMEDLKAKCKQLVSVADRDAVTKVLGEFKAERLADLDAGQYDAVAAALDAAVADADL